MKYYFVNTKIVSQFVTHSQKVKLLVAENELTIR